MKRIVLGCLAVLLAVAGAPPVLAQSGTDLFQQALRREQVDGDLKGAIALYQRILKEHATDRALSAKALVQIGQAYEKMGNADARSSYQRVIREYADQPEQVALARTRLNALSAGARTQELSVRQVWAGRDADITGSPSADGRFLAVTDWTTGNVAIRDIATGAMRSVTKTGDIMQANTFALSALYSPDNQQIAYAWYEPKKFVGFDLWVVGADGTGARLLYRDTTASVFPAVWAPDGKSIIASTTGSKDKTKKILLVSAANGSARVVKSSIEDKVTMSTSVSPDGRALVYDLPAADGKRDIYMYRLPDGPEVRLIEHPADDRMPIWQPDGERLLFVSDRTGSAALWSQRIADGKAVALPELVKQDVGQYFAPMGFTRNGALYFGTNADVSDVYVAAIDVKAGAILEPPAPISQQMTGTRYLASWSPDGSQLAYIRMRTLGTLGHTIIIRSSGSGEERSIPVDASTIRRLVWDPDGTSLIFPGIDRDRRPGVFRVDLKSGAVSTLFHAGPNVVIPQAGITRDGKSIVYHAMNVVNVASGSQPIVVRNLQTGQETVLTQAVPTPTGMVLSPDGQSVAVTAVDESTGRYTLMVVPVAGGAAREVYSVDKPRTIVRLPAWTPDGRQILCATELQNKQEYFLVPAAGGEPVKLPSLMNGITDVSFHPDGKHVAFAAGRSQSEVWVMENFLLRGGL